MYSESRDVDFFEDASGAPLLVVFPVKPRPHFMGVGRIEKGDSEIHRGSVLNSGSHIYIIDTVGKAHRTPAGQPKVV